MRVGFTGTQRGMTPFQSEELKKRLEGCTEFVFGDCIGADIEAANIAIEVGITIFTVYPQNTNSKKRAWFMNPLKDIKKEGKDYYTIPVMSSSFALGRDPFEINVKWIQAMEPLKRNKLIVDNCELLIATPKEFEHSIRSGTWNTIRYAWKTKRNLIIIPPIDREKNDY